MYRYSAVACPDYKQVCAQIKTCDPTPIARAALLAVTYIPVIYDMYSTIRLTGLFAAQALRHLIITRMNPSWFSQGDLIREPLLPHLLLVPC